MGSAFEAALGGVDEECVEFSGGLLNANAHADVALGGFFGTIGSPRHDTAQLKGGGVAGFAQENIHLGFARGQEFAGDLDIEPVG